MESYVGNVPPCAKTVEKEHVLACLKIRIGDRVSGKDGFLILDPGYHVSRVVTVMEDGLYPHTGKDQCLKLNKSSILGIIRTVMLT